MLDKTFLKSFLFVICHYTSPPKTVRLAFHDIITNSIHPYFHFPHCTETHKSRWTPSNSLDCGRKSSRRSRSRSTSRATRARDIESVSRNSSTTPWPSSKLTCRLVGGFGNWVSSGALNRFHIILSLEQYHATNCKTRPNTVRKIRFARFWEKALWTNPLI